MLTEALQNLTESSDHRVRLLLPFFWERGACFNAEQALSKLRHVAHKNKSWPCWEKPESIPFFYHDETLLVVRNFLFGAGVGTCTYLRVPDETANFWFKNGGAFAKTANGPQTDREGRPVKFEVSLAAPGIELFLSPQGAGVFSVTFAPKHAGQTHYLQELNYRLSQLREFTAYPFRLPHQDKDPHPAPDEHAALCERLGHAGGAFTLEEWLDFLLQPLMDLHYQAMQEQFSVYSVTRFCAAADFTGPKVQAVLQPYLAAVAHVEEYHHAGSLEVCAQKLNPRHWAAVGSLGAAHLVSDQHEPPHDFDEQRVTVSLHKYFIPYLLGMMQRIVLQRILNDAQKILVSQCQDAPYQPEGLIGDLRKLNKNTLMFTVNGWFTEISNREVLNQYYALAQRGLRVQDSFSTVQRALRDAELMDDDRFQSETLGKLGEQAKQAHVSAENMIKLAEQSNRSAGNLEELAEQSNRSATNLEKLAEQSNRSAGDMEKLIVQASLMAAEAGSSVENMEKLVNDANHSAKTVADVQSKLEWLEVFFVSYYATALVHYIGESKFIDDAYVHISLVFAPLFSGVMAYFMLEPDKPEKRKYSKQHLILFSLVPVFSYLLWLVIGVTIKNLWVDMSLQIGILVFGVFVVVVYMWVQDMKANPDKLADTGDDAASSPQRSLGFFVVMLIIVLLAWLIIVMAMQMRQTGDVSLATPKACSPQTVDCPSSAAGHTGT